MSLTKQQVPADVYQDDVKADVERDGSTNGSGNGDKNPFPARMNAVEKQEALRLAELADPGIPALSMRGLQFGLLVLCICCCSGDNGLDGTTMSAINSMTQWQSYFGITSTAGVPKTGQLTIP
jgi:hypothetical protein